MEKVIEKIVKYLESGYDVPLELSVVEVQTLLDFYKKTQSDLNDMTKLFKEESRLCSAESKLVKDANIKINNFKTINNLLTKINKEQTKLIEILNGTDNGNN